jgi:hypothetical protein
MCHIISDRLLSSDTSVALKSFQSGIDSPDIIRDPFPEMSNYNLIQQENGMNLDARESIKYAITAEPKSMQTNSGCKAPRTPNDTFSAGIQ